MDLVIRNGTVITMDAARRVVRADVLVRDGAIAEIGPRIEARPARVIDASQCAVVPGFVQAHVHLCQALFRGMADDLPLLAWLRERIWPLEAAHDRDSLYASARLGLAEMLLAGTTTILDMGTVHHQEAVFEAIEALGMRAFSGKTMMDRGKGVPAGLRESTKDSLAESERLCRAWHGRGRVRYAFAPRFILSCSEGLLKRTAAMAREHGALLHSHAAEHAEERAAVLEATGKQDIAALREVGIAGPDVVLAHGVQLTPSEMRAIARDGTRFVHCPSANLKLASGIAPVVAMREAGIVVALGADGAPCNNRMDPFTELRQAALLAKGRDRDASRLPAIEALAMATIDGARALGIDREVGSIEVGKRADVTVVRLDSLHAEPGGDAVSRVVHACVAADVEHVIVDGEPLVMRRALCRASLEDVRDDARRQAEKLSGRAGIAPRPAAAGGSAGRSPRRSR